MSFGICHFALKRYLFALQRKFCFCSDEKISEEQRLEGFCGGRHEALRRVSKLSYRRSSSASSVERESPLGRRRRADGTPDSRGARSDGRSGRSFSEDRSASGSGKAKTRIDRERRKVRSKEWSSSSDESEGGHSTDRMSERRLAIEWSRKASRLGKTKEEISHEEIRTTNSQKFETNRKKKSRVRQV